MSNEPAVIPFGKHKGRLLEEVMEADPAYLQWLTGQPWFRDRFVNLYQVIINRGAESEDTPEHNAMQVRFLEDDYCLRFIRCYRPNIDEQARAYLERMLPSWIKDAWEEEPKARLRELLERLRAGSQLRFEFYRDFEAHGADVVLNTLVHIVESRASDACYTLELRIEIKPVVGDDYPAVLRQMRVNQSQVLFVGQYTGAGATEEQFVKTFAAAGKRVIFAREVEST